MKEKLFMKACALLFVTLFFIGCSGGGGSSSTKASLSGTVYDSSSSSGGGIFKAGVKNKSYATETSSSKLPVSGANVLVFDLDSTSTAAAATTTTDSDGVWSTEIDAGHYIVFAVYLDLNTFTLKTARVDDVTAEEGKAVAVDDQVVATDETAPTIVSILDDTVATTNSDGQNVYDVYEPSSIPASSKIAIYFNESMSSTSIESALSLKEQVKNSDGEFVDGNAVDYSMENNGSLTEFRLIPTDGLTIGVTYKLTVASTAKDLANNQLGTTAIAAIEVMTAKEASEAFSIIYTKPAGSDTDVPVSAAISMAFNFPADFASFKQNFTITPALEGRIEIMGKTATFFPKGMMASETEYSVTVGAGVQDLSGNTLGEDYAFSFTTGTPLIFSDDQNALDIANIIGKFQAAMESGNFSALLHLLTPGFVAEEWDRETGELMKMDAVRFVEMLKEETSKQMGFGDIERIRIKEIANPTNTILAEHYKNSNGYDLYRGFDPIKWAEFDFANPQTDSNGNTIIPVKSGGDVIGVEKEVTDQWSGDKWMENFTYILAGGKFDSGNCATGQVTASIPKHDEFGRQVMDDTNGEPVMIQVTFTAVDGDCDDTNSWSDANDSNPGNNPWPQDGDTDPKNDPIPHNDSNLDEGLRDKVVSDDELWSSSESYYVVDASGGWQGVVNQDLKLTEINGPLGWPCTRFVQDAFGGSEVIDNNADGECDGDNDAGYDLTRVFVDESGNDITDPQVLRTDYWDKMRPVPFRFEVLADSLSVPKGERFDLEPDWWTMDDDDGDGLVDEDPLDGIDNDGDGKIDEDSIGEGPNFDPNRWTKLLDETSDAVMEIYYLTQKVKINLGDSPISFFPVDAPDKASVFVEIEISETWDPHPPFDPEHPETADLNGDGKVDDSDNNSFTHFEHRNFKFNKVADEWLLARISMGGEGGPKGGEFEIFGLPIVPVNPAPAFDANTSMPAGPPENAGTTPTFEWSFEKFPSDATVGSVIIFVMEMGEPGINRPPEPVKAHIRILPGAATQFVYGSGDGDDITQLVIDDLGSDSEEDFPISDPNALVPASALEDGKVYMWGVMAFTETQDVVMADFSGTSTASTSVDSIGESFPVLFATGAMPAGFGPPIGGENLKVNIR